MRRRFDVEQGEPASHFGRVVIPGRRRKVLPPSHAGDYPDEQTRISFD